MANETFRPSKIPMNELKPIKDASETPTAQQSLDQGVTFPAPPEDGQPVKFTGNMPPQMLEAIKARQAQQPQQPQQPQQTPQAPSPQQALPQPLQVSEDGDNLQLAGASLQSPDANAMQQSRGPRARPKERKEEFNEHGFSVNTKLRELIEQLQNKNSTYEEITLPSLGKFYDGTDGPVDGKLHIRPMTGQEEQILATPRFVKRGVAMNMIFNQCIQECATKQFDSSKLLSADRTYILIYLRGISYSEIYDVEVTCPFTQSKFTTEINLNDLYVDTCPEEFAPESLQGILPHSGYEFTYRLPIGDDEAEIMRHRERMMKFDRGGQSDDTLHFRAALMINDIEGLTRTDDIVQLLRHLSTGDINHLRNLTNNPPFGVDTQVEIVDGPAGEFVIDLPLEADFFFPRNRKTGPTRA